MARRARWPRTLPLVVTELGEDDCAGTFIEPFMQWLDGHGASYLAWSWNSAPSCIPRPRATGQRSGPWPLVTDYISGTPTGGYAQAFHDHLAAIVGGSRRPRRDLDVLTPATRLPGGSPTPMTKPDSSRSLALAPRVSRRGRRRAGAAACVSPAAAAAAPSAPTFRPRAPRGCRRPTSRRCSGR